MKNVTTKIWFRTLLGACIYGGASAGTSFMGMSTAKSLGFKIPELNFNELVIMVGVGIVTHFFAFLQKSPLPDVSIAQIKQVEESTDSQPPFKTTPENNENK